MRFAGELGGVLRNAANFGLFPFFRGLYELVVGVVEGAAGLGQLFDQDFFSGGFRTGRLQS